MANAFGHTVVCSVSLRPCTEESIVLTECDITTAWVAIDIIRCTDVQDSDAMRVCHLI